MGRSGPAAPNSTTTKAASNATPAPTKAEGGRRGPAVGLGPGEAVDEGQQTARRGHRARHVVAGPPLRPALAHQPAGRARPRAMAIGHVDEQRPAPRHVLGEQSAEDQADGGAAAGDGAVHAEGPGPLPGLGEGDGDQRQGGGSHHRRHGALQGPGAEEHGRVLGQAAEGGGAGEAQQAEHEHALATQVVGDPAPEQQQSAEGQGVGGHHPLLSLVAEMCRARCADGRAMVTTVASSTTMSWAMAITVNARNRLGSGSVPASSRAEYGMLSVTAIRIASFVVLWGEVESERAFRFLDHYTERSFRLSTGLSFVTPAPSSGLRADAVRNRELILAAADEAFASEGLSVSVDEIARRAGVGAGTLYRHFPTKEALFEAVLVAHLDEIAGGLVSWLLLMMQRRRCSSS